MLTNRLKEVLAYINPSDKLADIGCDHGYLALEAINKGLKLVQLVDNKEKPLAVAKKNLVDYESKAKVVYTLASGLTNILDEINVVAICGIGGDLISMILNDSIDIAKKMNSLILQANTKVRDLREYLNKHSFEIIDEKIVYDKGKFYQIIKCSYQENAHCLSEIEIKYGPKLIKNKTNVFIDFLKYKLNHLKNIKNSIIDINHPINKEINEIEEILSYENK